MLASAAACARRASSAAAVPCGSSTAAMLMTRSGLMMTRANGSLTLIVSMLTASGPIATLSLPSATCRKLTRSLPSALSTDLKPSIVTSPSKLMSGPGASGGIEPDLAFEAEFAGLDRQVCERQDVRLQDRHAGLRQRNVELGRERLGRHGALGLERRVAVDHGVDRNRQWLREVEARVADAEVERRDGELLGRLLHPVLEVDGCIRDVDAGDTDLPRLAGTRARCGGRRLGLCGRRICRRHEADEVDRAVRRHPRLRLEPGNHDACEIDRLLRERDRCVRKHDARYASPSRRSAPRARRPSPVSSIFGSSSLTSNCLPSATA